MTDPRTRDERAPREGEITCPRCDDEPRARGQCTRCRKTGIVPVTSLRVAA